MPDLPPTERPPFVPAPDRYDAMPYRRVGRSGLELPAISLGLWQNFGEDRPLAVQRATVRLAFDRGITHFDLANNYGPPFRAAEETFGRIFASDLRRYRDELVISTKAGYERWSGPYGDRGSRKYLLSSLDQSLRRIGLDHVDISTRTGSTRRRRWRRRSARSTPRSAKARRCTPGSPRTRPTGRGRRPRSWPGWGRRC